MDTSQDTLRAEKAARVKDLVIASAIMGVGAYAAISVSGTAGTGFVKDQAMDHTTLPMIWGVMLVLLGGLWGAQVLLDLRHVARELRARGGAGNVFTVTRMFPDLTGGLLARMAVAIVALVVYVMLFEELPFILLTAAFLLITLLTFGRPFGWRTILLSAGGGAAFHGLFVMFLKLPL